MAGEAEFKIAVRAKDEVLKTYDGVSNNVEDVSKLFHEAEAPFNLPIVRSHGIPIGFQRYEMPIAMVATNGYVSMAYT